MRKREANRKDVLDELMFISQLVNGYTVAQRNAAHRLYDVLVNKEFDAAEQIQSVIEILDKHDVTIPTGLKPLKIPQEVK